MTHRPPVMADLRPHVFTVYLRRFVPSLAAAACIAVALPAVQAESTGSKPSIFILAAHDSRLLTLCPAAREVRTAAGSYWESDRPVMASNGPYGLQSVQLVETRARLLLPFPASQSTAPGEKPSSGSVELDDDRIAPDQALAKWLTREFARHKEFTLVDSAETADVVFIAEGLWRPLVAMTNGSNRLALQMTGDWDANLLEAVLAFTVPAPVYRQHLGDINALLAARTWEGSVADHVPQPGKQEFASASPADLVKAFVRNAPPPRDHPPICAASNHPFSLEGVDRAGYLAQQGGAEPVEGSERKAPKAGVFRSGITDVSVPVRATDAGGHPLTDAAPSEFSLEENGVDQHIDSLIPTSEPFDVVVLIDTSASMRLEADVVQDTVVRFIDSLRPVDRVMPMSFNDRVTAHSDFLADRKQLRLARFDIGKGEGTRLWDALDLVVADRLHRLTPGRRHAIVLFTDGVDTRSRLADAARTMRRLAESDMPVYTVQFDTRGQTRPFPMDQILGAATEVEAAPRGALDTSAYVRAARDLQSLAETTGGRVYRAETLANAADAFAEIRRELSTQYTIHYYPSNQTRDGSLRSIVVKIARPDVTLRFRTSYRAPSR